MPQQITTAFSKLIAAIREFTVAQRTLALIGLGIIAVAIIALVSWISQPQMRPLYTDLAPSDAAAITEQLDSQGVKYDLANGGGTIMVPADQVYKLRLNVASSGISPSSEGGYQLFDNMGMSTSEFQQDVTYKRALEGELAKTINAMDGVETASVQLALPADTVFVSERADASASVFVKTRTGTTLSDDQVQAITHLVSASIESMPLNNVAVIDAAGNVLSNVDGAGSVAAGNKQTVLYESRIQQNVQAMLDRIVGVGNSVVSVTAQLDYSSTERTSETFNSNENAKPLTERTTNEEYEGTGNNATGVLGPDNIAVPEGEESGTGNYTNTTEERANAVDKVTEHVQTGPGTLRRQSISVAVDQQAAGAMNMADLQAAIATAAGIDEERGDTVNVSRIMFDKSSAEAAQVALAQAQELEAAAAQRELIRNAIIAGAALLAVIVLAIIAGRRRRVEEPAADEVTPLDLGELSLMSQQDNELAAAEALAQIDFPAIPELPTAPDPGAVAAEKKRQDVVSLADEDPEQVADYLRELMDVGGR
ncbi:flagellar basal-body MS-ring/collar protein FliF [Populibacterium corticicola]|uniref:Flagellar M-ring protein n=1 Tax=Populibacterium corticicola TaxID=1812826 RepID=A0ABW5XK39_9MICO